MVKCAQFSQNERDELESMIPSDKLGGDMQFVLYGSLARDEAHENSDVDWTLLVDGQADKERVKVANDFSAQLVALKKKEPGTTGTFGALSFSHELVHHIGGTEDTNINTTRRVLLLLESAGLGSSVVRNRVLKQILLRYVYQDVPLRDRQSCLPRFLLNDIVRFWRTMAVDYASKTFDQAHKKWAIRNIKLRTSRKLLYLKGLLMCVECHFDNKDREAGEIPLSPKDDYFETFMTFTEFSPLATVARFAIKVEAVDAGTKIIDHYEKYLDLMARPGTVDELEKLKYEEAMDSVLFNQFRDISHDFQQSVLKLVYESNEEVRKTVMNYGVF